MNEKTHLNLASPVNASSVQYAELHCISNFTFLRGASHPEELVARAAELNYHAIAITDECSLSGIIRAHIAAKQHGISLIVGSELQLKDGLRMVLLATNRIAYGNLSHLITIARRNAKKGEYHLTRKEFIAHHPQDCLALWLPQSPKASSPTATQTSTKSEQLQWLAQQFPQRTWIAVALLLTENDHTQLQILQTLGNALNIPLCANGDVHMHQRQRRALQDTLTAIRYGKPLTQLGYRLYPNGERHLRSRQQLGSLYPPALLSETIRIAKHCQFSLDELRYQYPTELVPQNYTAQSWLRHLVQQGIKQRYPKHPPQKIHRSVERELTLVSELNYEHYFLTVHDIVRYARSQGILCQGRGSAANSTICYCLGITEVNPEHMELLFERFISKERNEPPDIDVDFEHERREEVIQYIYRKYGRHRAALAATVITYQPRSAVRDIGKALGMSLDQVDRLAKSIYWWDKNVNEQLTAHGFSPDNPLIQRLLYLVNQLLGFPRHLSQHVGGFIISEGELSHLVPIENAAMPERTVIQWEKDDLEALGLLKIDVLSLGMLTAIRKTIQLINTYAEQTLTFSDIPKEDPLVYDMIQKADTIGVFQIESRAQMSMLPRLKPRNYYDLVVEIAIVRPGPIQGDMVHPYLRRRNGDEPITYPSKAVKQVLQRTLGIPIFQEQVMQLAIVAAGFTAGEADQLRRSMAAWKRRGGLEPFEKKLLHGMQTRGYTEDFAKQIFNQIKGFGDYGFPESHSASFALLAYISSWLKCHHPAAFTCALLNSQPMGFYAPAQLVQDAKRHNVNILAVDINQSEADCTLEAGNSLTLSEYRSQHHALKVNNHCQHKPPQTPPTLALRLGLRMVKGLSTTGINNIVSARQQHTFVDVQDLATRAQLNQKDLETLAAADALTALSGDRYRAYWEISGTENKLPLIPSPRFHETDILLRKPTEGQNIIDDYASTGLSLRRHPVALLRKKLTQRQTLTAKALWQLPNNTHTTIAGLVIGRQRPGTASGVMFLTLEDETGYINVVVWPKVAEQQRRALLQSQLLSVTGTVQQENDVLHLIAKKLEDLSPWLGALTTRSRDFC